jgi:hypothetical protein
VINVKNIQKNNLNDYTSALIAAEVRNALRVKPNNNKYDFESLEHAGTL